MSAELRAALELVMSSRHAPFIANGEPCKCVVHEDARAALASTSIDGVSGTGLEELRELSEKATPGPWHAVLDHERGDYGSILSTWFDGVWTADGKTTIYRSTDDFGTDDYADGLFIAAAVNYVRAALAKDSSSRA